VKPVAGPGEFLVHLEWVLSFVCLSGSFLKQWAISIGLKEVLCNEVSLEMLHPASPGTRAGLRLARGESRRERAMANPGYTIAAGDVEEPLGGGWLVMPSAVWRSRARLLRTARRLPGVAPAIGPMTRRWVGFTVNQGCGALVGSGDYTVVGRRTLAEFL